MTIFLTICKGGSFVYDLKNFEFFCFYTVSRFVEHCNAGLFFYCGVGIIGKSNNE